MATGGQVVIKGGEIRGYTATMHGNQPQAKPGGENVSRISVEQLLSTGPALGSVAKVDYSKRPKNVQRRTGNGNVDKPRGKDKGDCRPFDTQGFMDQVSEPDFHSRKHQGSSFADKVSQMTGGKPVEVVVGKKPNGCEVVKFLQPDPKPSTQEKPVSKSAASSTVEGVKKTTYPGGGVHFSIPRPAQVQPAKSAEVPEMPVRKSMQETPKKVSYKTTLVGRSISQRQERLAEFICPFLTNDFYKTICKWNNEVGAFPAHCPRGEIIEAALLSVVNSKYYSVGGIYPLKSVSNPAIENIRNSWSRGEVAVRHAAAISLEEIVKPLLVSVANEKLMPETFLWRLPVSEGPHHDKTLKGVMYLTFEDHNLVLDITVVPPDLMRELREAVNDSPQSDVRKVRLSKFFERILRGYSRPLAST